jgi:predicted transcriptional regulator
MTTGQQIKVYMDELGWDVIDLARQTNIHHIKLDEIINGGEEPTYNQIMIIVNKITKQYPLDQHWTIYQSIVIKTIFEAPNDTK